MANDDCGELIAEPLSNGKFRWYFTGPGGSAHYGAAHYRSAGAALIAGKKWLTNRNRKETR